MVLMAIVGRLGEGKTLALTYFILRNYWKGRKIYSNYHLNKIPYIYVSNPEDIENMNEGFFAGDEIWTWADSRLSGSHKNKFITSVLSKSRKRGINITYTCQYFKSVDIRMRTVTDFIAIPSLNASESICRVSVYSVPDYTLQQVFKFRTAPVFPLYDTKEEVKELHYEKPMPEKKEKEIEKPDGIKIRRKPKEKPVSYED